jgi:hypothetical protein
LNKKVKEAKNAASRGNYQRTIRALAHPDCFCSDEVRVEIALAALLEFSNRSGTKFSAKDREVVRNAMNEIASGKSKPWTLSQEELDLADLVVAIEAAIRTISSASPSTPPGK